MSDVGQREGASAHIQRFVRRLAAVTEPDMQEALWAERFQTQRTEDLLIQLSHLLAGVQRREEPFRTAYLSLAIWLRRQAASGGPKEEGYLRRREVYEAASNLRDIDVMRLLLPTSPPPAAYATHIKEPHLGLQGQEITLGHRRMMARTADRGLIGRLIFDPDPVVLQHILDNPLTVEQDAVRVAARRPTLIPCLEVVFNHPRWGRRPEVQRALLMNPYSPVDMGMALSPLMSKAALKAVSRDGLLSHALRRRASELLEHGRVH